MVANWIVPRSLALSRLVLLGLVLVGAGCSDKKGATIADAGLDEGSVGEGAGSDPARVKAQIAASCGDAVMCACMKERFLGRYSDAAISVMEARAVDVALADAREDCELRSGKLRDGVISTCMDGHDDARAACECAADAFLRSAHTSSLREILDRGWDRDTTNALLFEKKGCAAKAQQR